MPDKRYKTPNGQIASETELKSKYGEKFNSLLQNNTFSEVNEPVYKTPNGKFETESVLKEKYGSKMNELVNNGTFSLDYTPKKKESTTSTSSGQKSVSAPKSGSSDGQKQTFRLPTNEDYIKGQQTGEFAPDRMIPKSSDGNTYDLDANGNPIKKTLPPSIKNLIPKNKDNEKLKGLYQKGAENIQSQKDIERGYSKDQEANIVDGKLGLSTPIKDLRTKEEINKKISEKGLDNPTPYLFSSSYNKQPEIDPATQTLVERPKDEFVNSEFGDEKLSAIGVNPADFDGYLNEKGFKKDFLDKQERGLFDQNSSNLYAGNIPLAREIQKHRLLTNYITEINSRNNQKNELENQKNNIGKSENERVQKVQPTTLFDSEKLKAYYEENFPLVSKKLKERDVENQKLYKQIKSKDNGFWYGTKESLKTGWNSFVDRMSQTSATVYDKVGLNDLADAERFMHEENQLSRPDNRNVAYASGNKTEFEGTNYLVDSEGQVIDIDSKIRVTDLLSKGTYDYITEKAKKENTYDWVFSPQGSAIQTSGVLGDMIVQLAATRGVGGILGSATATELSAASKLSKIPLSKKISSAIISQSALGYSQGLETTLQAAKEAGLNDSESEMLANDAAQRMAVWYASTAFVSPQTKATEAIFGNAEKSLIKNAVSAYKESGKSGFLETLKKGLPELAKRGVEFTEEGGKEMVQENVQQLGENLFINKDINEEAGRKILKDTYTAQDFVNTSILSFASGGLISQMRMPNFYKNNAQNQLYTLSMLAKSGGKYESSLDEMVKNKTVTQDEADQLKSDVKAFSNNINKIPKDTNPSVVMNILRNLEDINEFEKKKKTIDKAFHGDLDEEIEASRSAIKYYYDEGKVIDGFSELQKELYDNKTPRAIIDAVDKDVTLKNKLLITTDKFYKWLSVFGQYNPNKKEVAISTLLNSLTGDRKETVLHEAVHAGTVLTIRDIFNNPSKYEKYQVASAKELLEIFNQYKESDKTFNSVYGLKDMDEFIAGFISNKSFQNYIGKNAPDKKVNFKDYVWQNILSTLGIKQGDLNKDRVADIESMIYYIFRASKDNINKNQTNNTTTQTSTPSSSEVATPSVKSSWQSNIEALINPQTGLAATIRKMDAGKKEKELFLEKKGLGWDDIANLTEEQKKEIQEEWVKSEEFLKLSNKNETTPTEPTTSDANISVGNNVVESNGTTEQQNTQASDVQNQEVSNSEQGQEEITPISESSTSEDILNWIENAKKSLDQFKDENLSSIIPIPIAIAKTALDAMAVAVKAGKVAKDVIQAGIDSVKSTQWYSNLSKEDQTAVEQNFIQSISAPREVKKGSNEVNSLSEKSKALGITEKQYTDFRDLVRDVPQSGDIKKYLSGETIEREYSAPRNDQSYDAVILKVLGEHGRKTLENAKELFGEEYVEKMVQFLDNSDLNTFEKGIQYAILENEMDARVQILNTESNRKLQDLVNEKSQENLRIGSNTIQTGRLRNILKEKIDVTEKAEKIYTPKQRETKSKIEKAVEVSVDDVNLEDQNQALEIEKAIKEGVEKQINEIYSKLPSNRRIKADKAIKALENIQKRLNNKAYDATIGVPVAVINAGIDVIKNSIKAGVNVADAIESGIDKIKELYGKKWDKEDEFRNDMLDGFTKEGVNPREKAKDQTITDLVKETLIELGYNRTAKINGEDKVLLDWKKLAGEEGSIDKLRKNVETALKNNGYSDAKIKNMRNALEEEYKRLRADIIAKSLKELERRDLIKPNPNLKSEARRLAELYDFGLFNNDTMVEFENLMNKTLGLSEFEIKTYQEIKAKVKALSEIYQKSFNGKKISEGSIRTVANDINHQIKYLLNQAAVKSGPKYFSVSQLHSDYVGLAQRHLLGGVGTLVENVISGEYQNILTKALNSGTITPELNAFIKKNKKVIYADIVRNAGLFYGDTNTSLISQSRFEDWINGKIDKNLEKAGVYNKLSHTIVSGLMLRAFLDGADSRAKVSLTNRYFIKNLVDILTSDSNPNGKMSKDEAVQYVSEQLTGENFQKALDAAKNIIQEVNSNQDKKQLKDTPEAVYRFAMDLVNENLIQDQKLTMDEVEASFKAAYKSAGRDIGHEANNPFSRGVNYVNSTIARELEKAVQEKRWGLATMWTYLFMVQRTIVNPFAGGGTNWVILGLEKAGPLGLVSFLANMAQRRKLDLGTETGKKQLVESLFRENNYRSSAMRVLVGTGISLGIYLALSAGDDEDENKKKLAKWVKENKWAKKYFEKFSPEMATLMVAIENKKLTDHTYKMLGTKLDYYDRVKNVQKSLDKENTSTLGAIGGAIGSVHSTPIPWKAIRDFDNIKRGLEGEKQIEYGGKPTGFWNGYFQGGLVEYLNMRPGEDDNQNTDSESKPKITMTRN